MERKIDILRPFFESPARKYSVRELSRISGINHTTVSQHLNKMVDEGYLSSRKEGIYLFYRLALSPKTLNLKLYYNLEKIRESGLIDHIEKAYDLPVIILFGSYASAMDDENSDIDLCIMSDIDKEFSVQAYEKALNRKVSLHIFSKKAWNKAKKDNPHMINNICNGIVLSGEMEIL